MKNISTEKFIGIVNEVAAKHSGITVSIDPSLTTNSIYVLLSNGDAHLSFRISDHKCPKRTVMKNIIVTPHTKRDNIIRFIENCYAELGKITLQYMFTLI